MQKSDLQVGDRVLIARVFYPQQPRHAAMIGKTGIVTRIYKTKDEVILTLDDGDTWHATPCNLDLLPPV